MATPPTYYVDPVSGEPRALADMTLRSIMLSGAASNHAEAHLMRVSDADERRGRATPTTEPAEHAVKDGDEHGGRTSLLLQDGAPEPAPAPEPLEPNATRAPTDATDSYERDVQHVLVESLRAGSAARDLGRRMSLASAVAAEAAAASRARAGLCESATQTHAASDSKSEMSPAPAVEPAVAPAVAPQYAAPTGRRVIRSADRALDFAVVRGDRVDVSEDRLRAVVVATGDVYEGPLSAIELVASDGAPRPMDAAQLRRLVERGAALAVDYEQPARAADAPSDRLSATYCRLEDGIVVLALEVRPADPVLDAHYRASIGLKLLRRATVDDKLEIFRRDVRSSQDVLVVDNRGGGRLTRTHPADLEPDDQGVWWSEAWGDLRLQQECVLNTSLDLQDLGDVGAQPFLHTFSLTYYAEEGGRVPRGLSDLGPLAECRFLWDVSVHSSDALRDLSPLVRLPRLEKLSLVGCGELVDASPLTVCARLRVLDVTGCRRLVVLPSPPALDALRARGCVALVDLKPLILTRVSRGTVVAGDTARPESTREPSVALEIVLGDDHQIRVPHRVKVDLGVGAHVGVRRPPPERVAEILGAARITSVRLDRDATHMQINLERIEPSAEWLECIGQTTEHGPMICGRLANVSVDLRETRVTRAALKVLKTWYKTLPEHGALIRLPDLRVAPPTDADLEADGWSDGRHPALERAAGTELFLPPAGMRDYMVDAKISREQLLFC